MLHTKFFRKKHPPVGSRPGTLVIDEAAAPTRVRAVRYDAERIEERVVERVSELQGLRAPGAKLWIDVCGLGSEDVIRELAKAFEIHPLIVEDLVNVPQRPKAETCAGHQLFILRVVAPLGGAAVDVDQVSILFGQDWVMSVRENPGPMLDPIGTRLKENLGPMRSSGADYLAYAILDTIVDSYYPLLDRIGEQVEEMEAEVTGASAGGEQDLERLRVIKRTLLQLRRAVLPLRDAIKSVTLQPGPFISEATRPYLRDVYDHCAQAVDIVEAYREMTSGILNTYLSVFSHRTNEVMKVLTIMASVFIPLTFLAGVYGMNFEAMPELQVWWAYPAVLSTMVLTAAAMVYQFKRKGWIARGRETRRGDDAALR